MNTQEDKRYKALDHPLRKQIIQHIAKKPLTYTQLLQTLEIESGHLAYHLRNLDELTKKDEQGYYHLNNQGVEAYNFINGKPQVAPTQNNKTKIGLIVSLIFLSIIAGLIIISIEDNSNNQSYTLKNETASKSLQALNIVYEILMTGRYPEVIGLIYY
jgi:hypothetical protein